MSASPHPNAWPYTQANKALVARHWDKRRSTIEIARAAGLTEAQAYNVLARVRDERHALRQGGVA